MSQTVITQIAPTAPASKIPSGILQRKCSCGNHTVAGGGCAECSKKKFSLQRKLKIGDTNDPLEQEADRISDQVMSTPSHSRISRAAPRIQRVSSPSSVEAVTAPPSVERVLASAGHPLEPELRQDMEQRFGHDFSHVRVHTGSEADRSAHAVSANAFTVGSNIVFATGRFVPRTEVGKRLLAHELTHVVQQTSANGVSAATKNQQSSLPFSTPQVARLIQRQPAAESEQPRQKIRKIVLDKQQNAEILELENRFESISLMEHCDPAPGNYTARVVDDPKNPGKRKWITNEQIGCKKQLGYIVKGAEASKLGTLEGVEQIDFEVRDSEQSAANTDAIKRFFTSDKGERASAEDLEKIAQAEFILAKAGVTADELLVLEQRALEAREAGQTVREAEDPAAWAAEFVQKRQQAGERALSNRDYLINARISLDKASENTKNGIKNVLDGHQPEERIHIQLRGHNLSYWDLVKAFEFELRSITETFLTQTQIALYRIEKRYLAGRNVGLEKDALKQAIEKVRPAVAERDLAESKRDDRRNKLTFYGAFPIFSAVDDPELAAAEAELNAKNEELQQKSSKAGLPVAAWKDFDFDAMESDDIEASRGALRQFVGHAHSQIGSAQKKIENVTTLYKADRMVNLTKATLGITKGSVFDDIISYRAKVDLSEDSFWSTLWNIVSIALIFVPGNIGLILRVAAGAIDATKAMNEYAELAGFNKRDLASAPSKLGVFLAVGGTLIDVPQMGKGIVKVLDTEASLGGKAASKASATETAIAGGSGEAIVKTGDDITKGAAGVGEKSAVVGAGDGAALVGSKAALPKGVTDETIEMLAKRRPDLAQALAKNPRAANALTLCHSLCIPEFASVAQVERMEKLLAQAESRGLKLDKRRMKEYFHLSKNETELTGAIDEFEKAMRKAGPNPRSDVADTIMDEAELLQQTGVSKVNKPGGPQQKVSTEAGLLVHDRRNAEALRQQLGNAPIPRQFDADVAAGDIITLDRLPNDLLAEVPLGVTSRVDRITRIQDAAGGVIYELKPNTIDSINKGLERMLEYVALANKQRWGGRTDWRGVIVVYDAAKARNFIPPR